MLHYFMSHGILVTYGEGRGIHQAAIFHDSNLTIDDIQPGFRLNTNGVPPMEVTHQVKEISEIIGDRERTGRFDPKCAVTQLDELNWAGFTYINKEHEQAQPVIMFINHDKYVDFNKWEEISTERALAIINQFAEPKVEE